ncbi:MAG: hypothetical protein ABIP95_00565, partial [Pelobium sp.]
VKSGKGKSVAIWIMGILLVIIIGVFYMYQKHVDDQFQSINSMYADDSATNSGPNGMASMDDYHHWKNATFTIPEYDKIPENFQRSIVKIFMDNGYYEKSDQPIYFFTKIADRAKDVYAFGHFTGGTEMEMAFILEKQDYESSALFIIASNGDLLFWKELSSELPTISRFKQGARIYTDEMVLKPSNVDGLIANNKGTKYAYLYNQKSKTFDKHYQYTEEDIKQAKEEEEREPADEEDGGDSAEQEDGGE